MEQMDDSVIIVGAGGHGKVVLSTLLARGEKVLGFVDDNPDLIGRKIAGYQVLGNISFLAENPQQTAILGIGNNKIRKKLTSTFPGLNWKSVIHPLAYVHDSVKVGQGTVIFAGAVIQPDTIIGKHTIINTSASIDHDCRIENYVHIAPGSHLAGNVIVKEGSFIGINSCAIFGVSIGCWSMIGAGSVVVKPIADYVYAKGAPAKAYKATIMELVDD